MGTPRTPVASAASGYIRFIDTAALLDGAKDRRVRIRLTRRVGQFVPAGFPLLHGLARRPAGSREDVEALRGAFDIGPTRTLQQDAEFGVLQIVDIALAGDIAGGERPVHGDQLHRPAEPDPDPVGQPAIRRSLSLPARRTSCA